MATIRNYRFAVHLLTGPSDAINESVSQSVLFGQSNHSSQSDYTEAQSVVLGQVVSDDLEKIEPSVTQSVLFGQTVAQQSTSPGGEHTLVLSQSVNDPPSELEEAHSVVLSHSFSSSTQNFSVASTVSFGSKVHITEWLATASNTAVFSDAGTNVHVRADAVDLSGEHNIRFSQNSAWVEILKSGLNGVEFSQAVDYAYIWQLEHEFVISQTEVLNQELPLAVASTLVLSHAFLADLPASTCFYNPILGGGAGSTMPAGIPNRLVRQSSVKLVYPAVSDPESWTNTATLRNPEIGDRTKLQMDRIFRESRGGTLQTYRDDDWPTQETISVSIRLVNTDNVDDFSDFIDNTLGKEIGYLDHEGNAWRGVMLTTADPLVRTRNDIIDISFELIVLGNLG
jgi:hypothetical protein